MANMYVCVPVQLVNMANEDISISSCIYPRNIWQRYILRFGHFPIAEGNYKVISKISYKDTNFKNIFKLFMKKDVTLMYLD